MDLYDKLKKHFDETPKEQVLKDWEETVIYDNVNSPTVSSSYVPNPPKTPLCRVSRTGVGHLCKNCNSTMPRSGFLRLFGKRYCDNKKCPNSKPEKNYY